MGLTWDIDVQAAILYILNVYWPMVSQMSIKATYLYF